MGLIFDINTAKLYESWYNSSQGRAMDKLIDQSIITLLKPQPGEKILDIGCGKGNHLLFFNKLGLDICGIDASPYMISRAKERLGNRCTLKTGVAENLPFDDNEFDLAVLINTLEFLDDPLQALTEAGRVAKRKVFIGAMNSLSWYGLSNKLQGYFHESIFSHVKFYNLWELKAYIKKVLGDVPIAWQCAQIWPPILLRFGGVFMDLWDFPHCPFGSFLGLSATILYRFKTDQHPLKIRLKEAKESIAGGMTMKHFKCVDGVDRDERSLSL
jgi:ubiquinone/menaquinone biosynthesis C-methylase UbiE